ncbi:DUF1003 domain-containing protein [Phyllobacterium sp. YR531]|uniref:DUF1003 domain-containing protein n=1 Tax=Phyllobacterium sp. YR531 TaxID=1144343 RepID=UPI00026FC389|nr:DUF1003 domain-containing protein [Phyllobacterium sp. YR531]EJN04315.1 putative membrane protein [Phyllobacterium sp. YR531]
MVDSNEVTENLHDTERTLLHHLRAVRRKIRTHKLAEMDGQLTRGQRIADSVAATMGSWSFIIIQTTILFFWILLNVTAYVREWDPYPFILLNLALSFQAAYAAPFIMMSQNRQQDIDRKEAANDYKINIKAELEIELLHEKIELLHRKIDELCEREVVHLRKEVRDLQPRKPKLDKT